MNAHAPLFLLRAADAGAHALPLFTVLLAAVLLTAWLGGRGLLRRTSAASLSASGGPAPSMLVPFLAVGFATIVGGAALFATIGRHLHTGWNLGQLDEAFIAALIASDLPEPLLLGFHLLSYLGARATLTGLCIGVGLLLWMRGRGALALAWVLAMAGNGLLNPTLKQVFERARPEHPTRWLVEDGFSFPSGHSSGAVVAYGMLAYLALRLLPPRWHLPSLVAAAGLAFSIGASRLFLRVHYPTDVLAGFTSGLAWLAVCITCIGLARWHRRRRADRPAPAGPALSPPAPPR